MVDKEKHGGVPVQGKFLILVKGVHWEGIMGYTTTSYSPSPVHTPFSLVFTSTRSKQARTQLGRWFGKHLTSHLS